MKHVPIKKLIQPMRELIIFEGCDCSGKTTTARKFADMYNFEYKHFDESSHVDTIPGFYSMFRSALDKITTNGKPTVFDRCWLSEKPYHSVFRPESPRRYSESILRRLDLRALSLSAVVVYCDPGFDRIKEEFEKRKNLEYLDSVEQLQLVYEAYNKMEVGIPVVKFDYTKESINELLEKIIQVDYNYSQFKIDSWIK